MQRRSYFSHGRDATPDHFGATWAAIGVGFILCLPVLVPGVILLALRFWLFG